MNDLDPNRELNAHLVGKEPNNVRVDVYESCIAKMRRGFEATKHNFSNGDCKRVYIYLSQCGTKLHYDEMPDNVTEERYRKPKAGCMDFL